MHDLQELWELLDYKGSPEMFTCYVCFYMSGHMKSTSGEVNKRARDIAAYRAGYEDGWGCTGAVLSAVFNGLSTHVILDRP